jgi:hypothetical protein
MLDRCLVYSWCLCGYNRVQNIVEDRQKDWICRESVTGRQTREKDSKNIPLIFFGQTSKRAAVRASARSLVNHEPFATPDNTDTVSRTRESVSSDVSSKNGPRSLIMRGMVADSASDIYPA